ncbi:nucleotide-sugar transporter-domain-containing protein [Dichotomocladium elegans]|nr:nucleotide-sugar transporter-domain-containing protein [Dichotomocladium elegans]
MRYSRIKSNGQEDQLYVPSTAVVMAEILKLLLCLAVLRHERSDRASLHEIFHNPREWLKMAIPAGLYALQNNWLYVALSNLEAATFQITYQLKTLSTALFSIVLLHRTISRHQWTALLILMVGVTLVQLQPPPSSPLAAQEHQRDKPQENPLLGLIAVLASCISSGFAGCYFEKLLKSSDTSMWIRNIQLGVFALLCSIVAMVANDGGKIRQGGLFQGYNWLTWLVIANQALGGLVVAVVVKYADNISKAFATSVSIILSTSISFYFFEFQPSLFFVVGAIMVIFATVLYGRAPRYKLT